MAVPHSLKMKNEIYDGVLLFIVLIRGAGDFFCVPTKIAENCNRASKITMRRSNQSVNDSVSCM